MNITNENIKIATFSVMLGQKHLKSFTDGTRMPSNKPNWVKRFSMIKSLIEQEKYDFICFQHVALNECLALNCQHLLLEKLPGYETIRPVGSDFSQVEDFVPIFYDTSKWALDPTKFNVEWFDAALSGQLLDCDNEHSIGGQVFQWGLFHPKDPHHEASPIYIYNTRLRNGAGKDALLTCIRQLVEQISPIQYPTVLAIDTQGVEGGWVNRYLEGLPIVVNDKKHAVKSRMRDAFFLKYPERRNRLRSQHNYKNMFDLTGNGMNDHIFVSERMEVFEARLNDYNEDGLFPSYHYPVEVELKRPVR